MSVRELGAAGLFPQTLGTESPSCCTNSVPWKRHMLRSSEGSRAGRLNLTAINEPAKTAHACAPSDCSCWRRLGRSVDIPSGETPPSASSPLRHIGGAVALRTEPVREKGRSGSGVKSDQAVSRVRVQSLLKNPGIQSHPVPSPPTQHHFADNNIRSAALGRD
ncbi:hypothetical protein AAFF_G00211830 [Aldrovandia affinis]|uniref:Uncharacterized protein n=1 Tax=Aldrovandia affinis TaxID=143900 RepID=A0AAD7RJQ8_9TELE|nr:hypothetical protein AAFF_G00211830 [Aldrovandia affinis]